MDVAQVMLVWREMKLLVYAATEKEATAYIEYHNLDKNRCLFVSHSVDTVAALPENPIDKVIFGPDAYTTEFYACVMVGRYKDRPGYLQFVSACMDKNIRDVCGLKATHDTLVRVGYIKESE